MTAPRLLLHETGDPAFDLILGGGIPERSVTVIAGEPGSGKTVLTLQMLFRAASRGQKCLYLTTLSEPPLKLLRYMQLFSFYDAAVVDQNIVFVDLGATVRAGSGKTLEEIARKVEDSEPAFVVIDSFRTISELLPPEHSRPFVYDLATQMAGWGATTFLVGEYAGGEFQSFGEFAIADGIIRLGAEREGLTSLREVEILKLRGANYITGRHFFDITADGVAFYPRVQAPLADSGGTLKLSDRMSTGVDGLDELLDGGIPRGSTTIVQGGTGTGKTLLGLHFLMAGIARGECGILFTQEETPEQLREIAGAFGWDLARYEAEGALTISYESPVELSTDKFLHHARVRVGQVKAQRAVFDSLTTLALGVDSDRRYKELIYAVTKHLRAARVTPLMTMESEQLLGAASLSGHGVSFIADNLVQLRYVELQGRLERAVSVLKARGVNVKSELRSACVTDAGMTVIPGRFDELAGVLTGLPSRAPNAR